VEAVAHVAVRIPPWDDMDDNKRWTMPDAEDLQAGRFPNTFRCGECGRLSAVLADGDRFKRLMRISGAAAGLPAMPSLKSMRSTAVTNLHDEGVALEVIANVTGHVDETVTRAHYLAVTAENTRQGFEILAERLRPRRSDRHSDRRPRNRRPEGGAATMN
jgi:hypothetical protein